jgi:hypothetical protein
MNVLDKQKNIMWEIISALPGEIMPMLRIRSLWQANSDYDRLIGSR